MFQKTCDTINPTVPHHATRAHAKRGLEEELVQHVIAIGQMKVLAGTAGLLFRSSWSSTLELEFLRRHRHWNTIAKLGGPSS